MSGKKLRYGIGPIKEFIETHKLRERFDALDPPNIAQVKCRGEIYQFYIPHAMSDKMQLPALVGQFHELPLLELFASTVEPGGVICDLGTNMGSHTLFFAAIMGAQHVHAFEPQAHLIDVIQKTLELNHVSNFTLHHAAAGAKNGIAQMTFSNEENSGMTEFRPLSGGASQQSESTITPVNIVTVDQVVGEAMVHGIKIDVEGMQMPALRGMSKTLRRSKPVLWMELRPAKGEVEQPSEWLADRGYLRTQISFRDFLFIHEDHARARALHGI